MAMTEQTAAGLFYMRKSARSRVFIGMATPWAPGLNVTIDDVCQSNGLAWQAQNDGTTAGSVGPNNTDGALFVDGGGVQWLHLPLLTVAPQPIG